MGLKLSLNTITTPGWPLERDIDWCLRNGVPAICPTRAKVEAAGASRAATLLRESGLAAAMLVLGGPFTLADRGQWPAEIDSLRDLLDLAAALGARSLQLLSGGGPLLWEDADARFREVLARVLPLAAAAGVPLCLEHNSQWLRHRGYVHTLHDALDLADAIDSPWLTICMEVQNSWFERGLLANLAKRAGRIGIVQVSDHVVGTGFADRVPVGDGDVPLTPVVRGLLKAGYAGYFDIEIVGRCVGALGEEAVLDRSLAGLRRLEAELEREAAG